ncbi:hypothetical protein [Flavobacterium sp. YJ01]|uniref:hypothetical protein n=1 Tax=unclassified Flavobacterium TaxID=196869 RepID=UPI0023E41B03|nr:hypothetical protein [Flavobacterium sp. YJ01]WET01701.1 hypothetical protein P0R33_18255 [Flavobacterium sp. YJ01]
MKKFTLLFAIAILFTIFSCTPDEYETQPTKKIEKPIDKLKADDDGPGDGKTPPIKPPTP